MTGSKAPQLKRLGQWLLENPMFDVDPKWAELVKERGNLPHDLQKRMAAAERAAAAAASSAAAGSSGGASGSSNSNVNVPTSNAGSSSSSKGKNLGRPSMMQSPSGQQSINQANLAATSMAAAAAAAASGLNFSSLGNLNNSLLSGLSLGNFDPKNNPLLMPFGGLPNLSALGGLGNLSNLGNISLTNSLFANLAGLGLPSLAGMEAALGAATSSAETSTSSSKIQTSCASSSSKSRSKVTDSTAKSSAPSTSSASAMPTSSPFPFFFPNPSLLYTPLGLGGLNPFGMQPGGVPSAYESLAQCGLLPPTSTASTSSSSRKQSTSNGAPARQEAKRKEEAKKPRYPSEHALSLHSFAQEMSASSSRADDKHHNHHHKVDKKSESFEPMTEIADLSRRSSTKEKDIKDAIEQLSRKNAELLSRNLEETRPQKRPRSSEPAALEVSVEPATKKPKESSSEPPKTPEVSAEPEASATEAPPRAQSPKKEERAAASPAAETAPKTEEKVEKVSSVETSAAVEEPAKMSAEKSCESDDSKSVTDLTKKAKKVRTAKRANPEPPLERKNLRSSAGRQARAAAERQAREGEQLAQQQAQQQAELDAAQSDD